MALVSSCHLQGESSYCMLRVPFVIVGGLARLENGTCMHASRVAMLPSCMLLARTVPQQ